MRNFPNGSFIATSSKESLPVALSYISAGKPGECSDDYELLDINHWITRGREGCIAYRVTGDSMLEHIKPGYVVIVDPYCEPQNGDVVVSRINGRDNVKIFKRQRQGLHLVSANKKYLPQKISAADDFSILGVVIGHFASYGR